MSKNLVTINRILIILILICYATITILIVGIYKQVSLKHKIETKINYASIENLQNTYAKNK